MAKVTLGPEDDGASVDLHVDEELAIEVPENWSTGYCWSVGDFDATAIEPLRDTFKAPSEQAVVGAGAVRQLVFRAIRPGTIGLELKHWRDWEGEDSVTARIRVTVRVT